jgi:propane 2-monooxygenase small subunit
VSDGVRTIRFEPIGEEIECCPEETVLDAAFRQGYNLVYGCREGQCSACKCFLLEGDVALGRYSNFALSDTERANGYALMCRAMPEENLVVEPLHYDPDNYRLEHLIADGEATVTTVDALTHDITRLVLRAPGFAFTPGQYVDLHVPGADDGAKRSFSMANLPGRHGIDERRIFVDKFTTSAEADPVAGSRAGAAANTATGPPLKRFEGAAAPTDESERGFAWFTPAKRRASLYEDVTIDTQPSIHRHLGRGWPVSFEDGRGTWDDASTALQSSDWFAFRDPGEYWKRPYYQRETAIERQIDGAMHSAAEQGLINDFSPEWVEWLRTSLQVPAYVEHGLWFALATIGRACLSDSVATCVCLQAAMKQRSAQALVLYAMDLEPHHGPFPIEAARDAFLSEAAWQPTRRYLERLAATPDWGEVIVAVNLCFEPVVGTLLRRELGIRAAAANGDTVTPVLARVATQEWEWAQAWSTELVRFLAADADHGEQNRAVIEHWIADWEPLGNEAALALAPFAEPIPRGIETGTTVERVQTYAARVRGQTELGNGAPAAQPAAARRPRRRIRPTNVTPPSAATIDDGSFDYVGIVMAKSAEGDAVAEILGRRDEIEVLEQPAFWDIRSRGRLSIRYDEVSEALGYEIDAYSIQHEMSTHYGRMVATDDALMLFSDPTEAMQYLMA